ncbi:arginine synthesis PII-interacting regulator PirA [Pantanalinema sp. GBBB05]|uniref:arginine synthesis PII-interacting regulator PirA n=1 Tax=Pantanalinema sp. GBBB05 TaxID=2604139 RepID=UPI001DF63C74|nr:DUF4278 domain-containing protein [Pantanalinema sp. GBBB05]
MKLSYRGATYDYNPPSLEVTESEVLSQHRYASRNCHTLRENTIPNPDLPLTYRGVTYTRGELATAERSLGHSNVTLTYRGASYRTHAANAMSSVTVAKTEKPVVIPDRVPVLKEVGKIHQANLRRNLERRLQVAKAEGNFSLIPLLEAEFRQLAL